MKGSSEATSPDRITKTTKTNVSVFIDNGSGSIKIQADHFNSDTGEVVRLPMPGKIAISLSADLEQNIAIKEIEASGLVYQVYNNFGHPLDLCQLYERPADGTSPAFLLDRYNNKFSESVRQEYLEELTTAIKAAADTLPGAEVDCTLVATAAARLSGNAQSFLDDLKTRLADIGITHTDFAIIPQRQEGILAFTGAVDLLKANPKNVAVQDIGGGSNQYITVDEDGKEVVLEGVVASKTFSAKAMARLGKDEKSFYPLDAADVRNIKDLGVELLGFGEQNDASLRDKIAQKDIRTVGVGTVNNATFQALKHNKIIAQDAKSYTQNDVNAFIELLTGKTEEEAKALVPDSRFVNDYFTNAVLLSANMEKFNINSVEVLDVSNVDALRIKYIESHRSPQVSVSRVKLEIASPQLSIDNMVAAPQVNVPNSIVASIAAEQSKMIATPSDSLGSNGASPQGTTAESSPPPVTAQLPDIYTQAKLALVLGKMVSNAYSFVSDYLNRDPKPITVNKDLEETNNKLHQRLMRLAKAPKLIDELSMVSQDEVAQNHINTFARIDRESKALREAYYNMKDPSQKDLKALYQEVKALDKQFKECAKEATEDFPEFTNRSANNNPLIKDRFAPEMKLTMNSSPEANPGTSAYELEFPKTTSITPIYYQFTELSSPEMLKKSMSAKQLSQFELASQTLQSEGVAVASKKSELRLPKRSTTSKAASKKSATSDKLSSKSR